MGDSESMEPLSDEELDTYGFVTSSARRRAVVKGLYNDPGTPKEIANRTEISLSHLSNILSELADEDVAVCVNPDRKRGRVYRLTELGNRVAKTLFEE